MLTLVGMPDPETRVDYYPHQMSGGMRQRAMIAMALVCHPKVLIADAPTTALDVTIQAQILELLDRLQAELGMGVLLIAHDLGVVAGTADRVLVMYAGQVVETAPTTELFAHPKHPYTEGLLASIPRLDAARPSQEYSGQVPAATTGPPGRFHPRCPYAWDRCATEQPPLLDAGTGSPASHMVRCWLLVEPQRARWARACECSGTARRRRGSVKEFNATRGLWGFGQARGVVRAVDHVSFRIAPGQTLGLVGESGCGKSTVARTVLRLLEPDSGRVVVDGADVLTLRPAELRALRRRMQIVFQDPYGSLNPRMTVRQTLVEPLVIHGLASGQRAPGARRRVARGSRTRSPARRQLPARAVGRAAPARRDCARVVGRTQVSRARRARERARRVGPGAGVEPAFGSTATASAHVPVHCTRPRGSEIQR
jgi:peptide/nickel transport system ATP-binding protein